MKTTKLCKLFYILCILYFTSFKVIYCTDRDPLEDKYGRIIHVSVAFRHGDRTPAVNYPLDPYINYPWKDGMGQLSADGKRSLILLGKWLRTHYTRLLQSIDSHTDIRIDSSDKDRTIMSAQCLMAGFYRPNKSQIFSKWLKWHPVPIHVVPKDNNMINPFSNCPAVAYYGNKFFLKNKWKKKYDKFEEDLSYLEKHTGLQFRKNKLYDALNNVYFVWDTLTIEKKQNLTLPKWTKEVYPRTFEKIMKKFMYKELKKLKIQRVMTGRIFESLTSDMRNKVENPNSTNTFHFYSGHDAFLAGILKTLEIYDGINPPFGAILVLEVRKKAKDYIVIVRYKKSQEGDLKVLEMPKCKTPCALNNFLDLVKPVIPKNIDAECQINES